jgi:hypothetical protein
MLTKEILVFLSEVLGNERNDIPGVNTTTPFGGMNIIMLGDFHQFPPVGNPSGALYCTQHRSQRQQVGQNLFEQFTMVVDLREQIQVKDARWVTLLARQREGGCMVDDVAEVRKLVLTNKECETPDFSKLPWSAAVLVTPRHSVRSRWNSAALHRHCANASQPLYVAPAEDTVGSECTGLNLETRIIVAGTKPKDTEKLEQTVEMAIGMSAMVILNIATEADLTNGTRGEIVDIVLDPRENIS